MNTEETVCAIEQLPFEMLCKIFDYLDIWSVKYCSRTCRRWQKTIFSDYYIKRFCFTVRLPSCYNTTREMENSDRLYCNMHINLNSDCSSNSNDGRTFNTLYSIFCYPKLEQLVTLKLTIEDNLSECIRMIMDAITRMKVLRELHIESTDCYTKRKVNILKIRSKSIELLVLRGIEPSLIKTPKLSSLHITTKTLIDKRLQIANEKRLFSFRIPSLKSLEIDKGASSSLAIINNMEHVLRFLNNHKQLEKLNLMHVDLSGFLFKAICENCTNLKELSIESLVILDTSTLLHLSNLAKLRHIQFNKITCLEPVSFQNVKLPNLDSLGIGSFPLHYETLDAFESVSKITILSNNISTDFITALAIKIPKLKQVELKELFTGTIRLLKMLPTLEVLVVPFPLCILNDEHPGITKIKEIHCRLEYTPRSSDIAILRSLLPTLQLITAGNNFKIRFQN
ncbi:uncharacterized protein LOC128298611 [Anopheles moucheti]|uniref:uncharacterized protein LOC128298611 n=1 Tax=Anopheles moucheti TaxID=186751 RepID=UPI0022F07B26|nr:uncharacterized protein LOC128298611 [Anopheles moucheti]